MGQKALDGLNDDKFEKLLQELGEDLFNARYYYDLYTKLEEDKKSVSLNTNPKVKKLIQLRGNYVAHTGLSSLSKPITISLSEDDISELIDKGIEIFNRYLHLFKATIHHTKPCPDDDYKYVLKSLAIREKTEKFRRSVEQLQRLDEDTKEALTEKIEQLKRDIDTIYNLG